MAGQSHLRQINQNKVLRALMRLRAASRTQLAREAALSQPTVGRIVDRLLDHSILTEAGDAEPPSGDGDAADSVSHTRMGRPSQTLQFDRRRKPRR